MLPVVLSIVGSLLPSIVDSLRSGKSPEEAAQIIAPKRKELIDRLVGSGLSGPAAEAMADEAMKGELEKAQLPEAMNPLVMSALSVAGMFGGMKAGNMIKASRAAKAAAGTTAAAGAGAAGVAATAPKTPASAPAPAEVAASSAPVITPEVMTNAEVASMRPANTRGPFPSPAMDNDFASLDRQGQQVPGRNTRKFTTVDSPFPARIGMDQSKATQRQQMEEMFNEAEKDRIIAQRMKKIDMDDMFAWKDSALNYSADMENLRTPGTRLVPPWER